MAMQEIRGDADPKPTGTTKGLPPDQPKGGSEGPGDREIAEALAREMGLDMGDDDNGGGAMDDFMASVREDVAASAPKPTETSKADADGDMPYVHEPSGKRFKTELELLRHDSGWNNDKWGNALKELREENQQLREEVRSKKSNPDYIPTTDDVKRSLWPSRNAKELSEDAAADFVMEAVSNAINLYDQRTNSQLQERDALIAKLQARLDEGDARNEHRVDRSIESRFVEKYPGLAKLPPAERVAVIAGLAAQSAAPERESSRRLSDNIPTPRASDHVESTAASIRAASDDELDEGSVFRAFDKKSPEDQLSILGGLVKQQRSFAGYEVDY